MDVKALHHKALDAFTARVADVPPGAWHQPTPCDDWDVRALVNHVVAENRWAPFLLGGATVNALGDALDGDLLGGDPAAAWHASVAAALDAVASCALDATVHLSFGDATAEEYLWQLTADTLVHAWDLARSTGGDDRMPDDIVVAVGAWFDLAPSSPARPRLPSRSRLASGPVIAWSARGATSGRSAGGGHVRGVDLFAVRDGRVAEKLSYVKG